MNTSQYMDKQIMDLQISQTKNKNDDFIDLSTNSTTQQHHDVGTDEILPNYDFQPISPIVSSHLSSFDTSGPRVWSSAESKANFATRNYGSLNSVEPSKAVVEKDRIVLDAALISEIDRTMKQHADNLMHVLEGVSARLSQLDSRSRNLENSVDDLRTFVGNNHGITDGKLRQIENIIREVQAGVQNVKDKQEILEAQLQLSQVQSSKPEQQPQPQMATHLESFQPQVAASASLQSHYQLPPAALAQPLPPALPNAPPPPPPVHHPNQFPENMPMPVSHHDPYYSPPGQTAEAPPQQQHYQLAPPQQQLQPPKASPPSPQPQYPPQATHMQYSQPPPMSLQQNPSQTQPPMSHHSEELAFLSSQNYPPGIRQPGGGGPPPQQFNMNQSQMYEPASARTGSGFPNQYGPSSGFNEAYNYGGSGSQYGSGSPRKSQQHSPPNMGPGGGSGYPQLPTARILPQSLPTAAPIGGGSLSSGSGNSGNRVPIDDVVDKVTHMGFPRDQVRATVKKLTENGQAVDLNVVLDKLMTDGVESQNPRAWFGR